MLRARVPGVWTRSQARIRTGKVRIPVRKAAQKQVPLDPRQKAWIRAVVQGAHGDPRWRNTLHQAGTRVVWRSVLGAIVRGALVVPPPEPWASWPITQAFLTGTWTKRDGTTYRETKEPRFSGTRPAKAFLGWLQAMAFATRSRDSGAGIPGKPWDHRARYDITALMQEIPARGGPQVEAPALPTEENC